jgi:hypothetical protein
LFICAHAFKKEKRKEKKKGLGYDSPTKVEKISRQFSVGGHRQFNRSPGGLLRGA